MSLFTAGNIMYNAEPNHGPINALIGEATYEGGATGYYANTTTAANAGQGTFTADAEVTADFEDGDAAGSISGSITNFVGSNGSGIGNWVLNLGAETFAATVEGRCCDRSRRRHFLG